MASACLYSAGMVLNDFFDVEEDRRERPDRPIPSGQVSRSTAGWFGAAFLAAGLLLAACADVARFTADDAEPRWLSTGLAVALAAAVLLYDAWLKRTFLAPVGMGTCRFLNVLFGLSACGSIAWPIGPHLALVVGCYVAGVTWLARTEAQTSQRGALVGAAGVIVAGLVLALPVPLHHEPGAGSWAFTYLLVALGFAVWVPIQRALDRPQPEPVQAAVKRCLLCLIALDAVLATGLVGAAGLTLLVLWLPALYLARRRWLYVT
jgi:4-hydroxybenzoate polyprenyltransferase